MPELDSTLRHICQWKTSLRQIWPAPSTRSRNSWNIAKWLYPSERGLPWTCQVLKRHWKELPCRVLGHLLEQGVIAKIADDLYCGGNSPHELLQKWRRVLQALHKCNLCLSSSKTIINPQSRTVLGWVWNFLKQVHMVLQPSTRAPSLTR